jgi:hypothetical protein
VATQKKKPAKKQEYVEQDGWMSAFFREDAEGKQPKYTGTGLDHNGNDVQVAVWPTRAKTGTKYLRIHIEEPYESDEAEDAEADEDDDDDIPF